MTRRYTAFISYSWSDKAWAGWLHRALETYRTPRALVGAPAAGGAVPAGLHPIFKDREEEAAGHSIGAAIEAAMAASEFLIVVCSPRSAQSNWVNREIAWFKRHRDPRRILAVVVDGDPGASLAPGATGAECFPPALLYQVDENLAPTDTLEDPPLAADARSSGDGRRGAKLKIAAALLGIGLDDLVRRDERRRQARRRIVTGAALSLTAITTSLAIAAMRARDEARVAQHDAETQRDEAQALVEFMLTDFRGELESLGRLDVLERTGERLLQTYAREDISRLDADSLGRRARVLLLLGEVDNARGKLDEALARYKDAAAATGELLARNAGKPQQIFDHAQSVYWVGYIAWQKGDLEAAKREFALYHAYAQDLTSIDPENPQWRQELSYAHSNLGTLALDAGEPARAEDHFRKALAIEEDLAQTSDGDIERALSLGQAYAWLSSSLHRQSKLREAHAQRTIEVALYRKLANDHPKDLRISLSRSEALARLAQVESALGESAAAIEHAREAARLAAAVLEADAARMEAAYNAATAFAIMSDESRLQGEHAAARESIEMARQMTGRLRERHGAETTWTIYAAARSELVLANIEADTGARDEARRIAGGIVELLDERAAAPRGDPLLVRFHAAALLLGARMGARPEMDQIDAITQRLKSDPGPESIALLFDAGILSGDLDLAARSAQTLGEAGYRRADLLGRLAAEPLLAEAFGRGEHEGR